MFLISPQEYDLIELCKKLLFQIELARNGKDRDFGFRIAAELADDLQQPDSLCIFINEITRCGMAYRKGPQAMVFTHFSRQGA